MAAEAVMEVVVDLALLVDMSSVIVVTEAVAEAVMQVVAFKTSIAVLYCCLDSPKSRWTSLNETFHSPFSSAFFNR